MSRLRKVLTVPTLLLALLIFVMALNIWQRHERRHVAPILHNADDVAWTIRITDEWSGRDLGTWRVAAGATVRLIEYRFDDWWNDRTETDDGRRHQLVLEVMPPDTCEILVVANHSEPGENLKLSTDGALDLGIAEWVPAPSGQPARVDDPCQGREAPPRGTIVNRTRVPIAVGPGVIVGACSERAFHAGDLAAAETAGEPEHNVVALAVKSIDIQKHRWPMEPRTVLVGADQAWDSEWSGLVNPEEYGPCRGVPWTGDPDIGVKTDNT